MEVVVFEPNNKDHRAAARAFMKRKAWADSPLRFTHDPEYGSVAEQVQAKLLQWYVSKEEDRESKRKSPKQPDLFAESIRPNKKRLADDVAVFPREFAE